MILRSLLYHPAVFFWTLLLGVIFAPLLLFARALMARIVPRFWTGSLLFLARALCGITHEVRGREHIADGAAIYAMKHQSAWETFALWHILPAPVFILKEELLRIPVFGAYLAATPIVAIDRAGGKQALQSMLEQARGHLAAGRQIIIFPEGTRTQPGATGHYHSGVAALYDAFPDVPLIPVALNSGLFWGKNAFLKKPGVITVEFLLAMPPALERAQFMKILEEKIESASGAMLRHH